MFAMVSNTNCTYASSGRSWLTEKSTSAAENAATTSVCDVMMLAATGRRRVVDGYRCRRLSMSSCLSQRRGDGCNGLPIGSCRGWLSMPSAIDAVVYLNLPY